jgi:WD40 repeat protein
MVWDVLTKTCVKTIHDHPSPVSSLASSPDGRFFASSSLVDSIIIYDAKTFDRLNTILVSEPVYSVSFSPKGNHIVHAAGHAIHTIDLQQLDTQTTFRGYEIMVLSAVFSPDGSTIASASGDGNIKLWQCDGGTSHDIKLWQCGGKNSHYNDNSNNVITTCISADGQKIISGSVDGTIMIWDANRGQRLETFPGPESGIADAIALSPTTSLVVSHYLDGQLRLWDYRDPGLNGTATVTTFLPSMRFTPDGSEMIASDFGSSTVERWEICLSPPGLRCLGIEQVSLEQPYRISDDKQWVLNRGGRRVCWLPPERRGYRFDCSESKVALGSESGKLTILDADVHA